MARTVIPQRRRTGSRPRPKHRMDGTFKVSKRGKYNAQGVRIDGHWFASKAEGDRYCQLKRMEKIELIHKLDLQPKYPISVDGHPICTYIADFRYTLKQNGKTVGMVVEDVKGVATPEYILKKKLFRAKYGMEVCELPGEHVEQYEMLPGWEAKELGDRLVAEADQRRKEKARAKKELEKKAKLQEKARQGVDPV